MKRLVLLIIICIIGYSVYFDIKFGTLPHIAEAKIEKTSEKYYNVQIEPGDTVISLIEKEEGSLPVSIEQIIKDFKKLNNGLEPEKIKIGQTYRLKDYE